MLKEKTKKPNKAVQIRSTSQQVGLGFFFCFFTPLAGCCILLHEEVCERAHVLGSAVGMSDERREKIKVLGDLFGFRLNEQTCHQQTSSAGCCDVTQSFI